jgi:hypothetical protein
VASRGARRASSRNWGPAKVTLEGRSGGMDASVEAVEIKQWILLGLGPCRRVAWEGCLGRFSSRVAAGLDGRMTESGDVGFFESQREHGGRSDHSKSVNHESCAAWSAMVS